MSIYSLTTRVLQDELLVAEAKMAEVRAGATAQATSALEDGW